LRQAEIGAAGMAHVALGDQENDSDRSARTIGDCGDG
jgi:hypothetical protein